MTRPWEQAWPQHKYIPPGRNNKHIYMFIRPMQDAIARAVCRNAGAYEFQAWMRWLNAKAQATTEVIKQKDHPIL